MSDTLTGTPAGMPTGLRRRTRAGTLAGTLVGTTRMIGLAGRRDRWLLSAWLIGLAAMAGVSAKATVDLYPDVASREEAARSINASAALVALYGRIYDPGSLGEVSMIKLTAFGSALVGVLMLFIVVRHTRAEEEEGRLELLSGGRLGHGAPLAAALVLADGASLLLGLLTAAALAGAGLPVAGSVAFGLGWTATGVAFASVGAVVAQVTTSARAARGLGLVVLSIAYALRAIGDLAEPGPSWLSWLSPIGWTQQVRAFAGDRWWVLLLPLALSALLVPAAFVLRVRRDLGAGLLADRPGPARGSIDGVRDLAVRLQGRILLGWAVGFAIGGVLLGSIASSITDFLASDSARQFFSKLGGSQSLIDSFIGAELGILGAIAAAYGISAAGRLRTEEVEGHVEPLLATTTTRLRWAASHVTVALLGVVILMVVAGVAMGTATALALHDGAQFGRVLAVALAQIPAAWVMTGLVVTLFGWAPRATPAAWGVFAVFLTLGEFGVLWNAPAWLMDLSPFQHTPRLPVTSGWALPLSALTLVAATLVAAGLAGWRERDVPA
ncbi:MAG TPA: ABC transporter permease [Kineosporiaceae bacterium]|nr:ABC transporter permease [Kineosporiaceae bacterium]